MKLYDKIILGSCAVLVAYIISGRMTADGPTCAKFNASRIRKLVNSSKAFLAAAKQDEDPMFALLHIQEARLRADIVSDFITNSDAKKYLDLDLDAYTHNLHDMQDEIRRLARKSMPSLSY